LRKTDEAFVATASRSGKTSLQPWTASRTFAEPYFLLKFFRSGTIPVAAGHVADSGKLAKLQADLLVPKPAIEW
jgi:hypothetical protein